MKESKLMYISVVFAAAAAALDCVYEAHGHSPAAVIWLLAVCALAAVVLQYIVYKAVRTNGMMETDEGKKIYSTVMIVLFLSAFAMCSAVLEAAGILPEQGHNLMMVFLMMGIVFGIRGGYLIGKYNR